MVRGMEILGAMMALIKLMVLRRLIILDGLRI